MRALASLALLASLGAVASAQSMYRGFGLFNDLSQTFDRPASFTTQAGSDGFGQNGGSAPYRAYPFTVDVSGTYVAEMYSGNSLDTMFFVYEGGFDATRPLLNLLNADGGASTSEAFTLVKPTPNVPGNHRARISTTPGTGNFADGTGLGLVAGKTYYFVASSPYSLFGSNGGPTGGYEFAIGGGPGNVTAVSSVPEPATLAALGLGAAALLRRRRVSARPVA